MHKTIYVLFFMILFMILNGCTSQQNTLQSNQKSMHASSSYSLESLELRYQQKGY